MHRSLSMPMQGTKLKAFPAGWQWFFRKRDCAGLPIDDISSLDDQSIRCTPAPNHTGRACEIHVVLASTTASV
jgi:hypothetical protein